MTKYRNVRDGQYDSRKEAKRGAELDMLLAAKLITGLCKQHSFELIPKQEGERAVTYTADFTYYEEDGDFVVEDVKSEMTRKLPAYVIKRKLLQWVHGHKIVEV